MRTPTRLAAVISLLALTAGLLAMASPALGVAAGANGWVAFVSDRTGSREIYIMRSDGTAQQQITFLGSNWDPSWSPDGTQIAFVSDRDGTTELYTMGYKGANQTRITTNTMTESHPTWSPKGVELAFAGLTGTDSDIYRMTIGTNHPRDMTPDTGNFDADPSWSPGGLQVAFDRTPANSTSTNIWEVQQNTLALTQLTFDGTGVQSSDPSWSGDNKTIVFQTNRDATTGGPFVFASNITKPDGILALPGKLLVTQFSKDTIRQVDASGNVTLWANLPPTGNKSVERYIALSSGLNGFTPGNIFATVGQDIYQITPDGQTVTLFTHIASLPNGETGITFDTVGTFGFNMILTDRRGPVWSVNSAGVATQIGDFGRQPEAPVVAPMSWAPFGGQLLVGNELPAPGGAWAMNSAGVVSHVADWTGAESMSQIPASPCTLGSQNGAFFISMEAMNEIMAFPASQFAGLGGDWIIPSETVTDIGRIHSDGTTITTSQFWGPLGTPDLEGSTFAACGAGQDPATQQPDAGIGHEIYKMNADGTGQQRLTNNAFDDVQPAVSPNSATVVFQSDRDDPNYPGCEANSTCKDQLFTMDLATGANQTDVTNAAGSNTAADWETISTLVQVIDFKFKPQIAKPKQGGTVLWDFIGPSDHTVTDSSGIGLWDSGQLPANSVFVRNFGQAGSYPYVCTIHAQMTGTVNVPTTASPLTGGVTTVFTIQWATATPPPSTVMDIQILRPGQTDWANWRIGSTKLFGTFTPDAGTGTYSFRALLRSTLNQAVTGYSPIATITVS